MSDHPYWLLNFHLRPDLPQHVLTVLADVARDVAPDPAHLARLHPVVDYYLSDWRRMVRPESPLHAGTPIRLSRSTSLNPGERESLTIEFSQHADEYADGGWVFWLWVLSLAFRPLPGPTSRRVIGFMRPAREVPHVWLYAVDAEGVEFGDRRMSYAELDSALHDIRDGFADYGSSLGQP